ncbi:hypothetical protein CK203_010647 [Vitis vinifera]|uniref:Uncharacterized protein n=1 Tax=Vitis vinifera TaxID=29760 RepID=A0A438JTS5_VITVI|nr:hypothetical protein CK203_010647 [Vitis vinifera]
MVNTVTLYKALLQTLMKLAGVEPRKVEIEPGNGHELLGPHQTQN